MLFIREYNAKSLDRSSVSMIDKYNTRLDKVGQLLDMLSSLINNLLSLIRDIRNILGQSKQRIYDNLDQVKEVIEGNGITGTDSTVDAIEGALEAGDKAIDEAEATLEGVERAIECSEEYCDDTTTDVECGETCNETPSTDIFESCEVCAYTEDLDVPEGHPCGLIGGVNTCAVCAHEGCNVSIGCNEECNMMGNGGNCTYSYTQDPTCGQGTSTDASCNEIACTQSHTTDAPEGCNFTCSHFSACQELPIPDDCTYTCKDGDSCNYDSSCNECSYSSVCSLGAIDALDCTDACFEHYLECGEACGETCHMTTTPEDRGDGECSEGSCGEDDESDDGPCNQFDCSEYDCGEPCGETCGLF